MQGRVKIKFKKIVSYSSTRTCTVYVVVKSSFVDEESNFNGQQVSFWRPRKHCANRSTHTCNVATYSNAMNNRIASSFLTMWMQQNTLLTPVLLVQGRIKIK